MADQQSSYRQIFKSTGLFGGVQIITILINFIRTKFIAVFLGTAGVGMMGLLNAPVALIASLTGLGISYSAIRDISEAAYASDAKNLARTLISFRRWVLFTGLLGMFITILLSPWLSKWTFGNSNYTWAFIWLSVTLFLNAISGGQRTFLQGMRKLQSMAKATVIGSLLGLFTSVPLYYYYGLQGIVPAMIITAIVSLMLSWYFTKQVVVAKVTISYADSYAIGVSMLKLGILISISAQIGALVLYLMNSFIIRTGGMEQVGLYSAGMGLVGSYIGIVFTAMGMDYYPKLAAISKDNFRIKTMVNQQAIMSVLIISPFVLVLLTTMPIVIRLLLTKEFYEIIPFVNLTVLGVIIKAVGWTIGYISLAKGDSKVFFWLEGILSNSLYFILSVAFYKFWGLNGIGIAFIANYIIYLIIVYQIAKKRYDFSFEKELYIVMSISILLSLLAFSSIIYFSSYSLYIILVSLIVIGISYSYYELNKRMNLKPIIISFINKLKKKDNNI